MRKKILHICSNYFGSKVHKELYMHLDNAGLPQTVYSYFDGEEKIGKNMFEGNCTYFIYSDILNPVMRKIYPYKEHVVYKDLSEKAIIRDYSCVYATTLFSDGGIAYKIKREYGIPYIVAVRNTDINYFMPHSLFWRYGRAILLEASKIVFISTAKQNEFSKHKMVLPIFEKIRDKIILQPNGIDSFWINNRQSDSKLNNYQICYVGIFTKEKNVINLIKAVKLLREKYPSIYLNIVGGGGDNEKEVVAEAKNSDFVKLHGYITAKNNLQTIFRENSLFAMPSHHETFGLVYLEAMSQGLPVIYTKNEGIDGMFTAVGEAVLSTSVDSIKEGIDRVFSDYSAYQINEKINFGAFDWNTIARNYLKIFQEVINQQ